MKRPNPVENDLGRLDRPRIDHDALDIVARSFDEKNHPRAWKTEFAAHAGERKGLLLYQLRALADLMPPSLAEEPAFASMRAYVTDMVTTAKTPTDSEPVDRIEILRNRLAHLRNRTHEQCGAAAIGEAWKKTMKGDSPISRRCDEFMRLGQQAYPYYLIQHLSDRLKTIDTDMNKPQMSREHFAQFRNAVHGAINQYFSDLQPMRGHLSQHEFARVHDIDQMLQTVSKQPKLTITKAWMELSQLVKQYDKEHFLRADPMNPGRYQDAFVLGMAVDRYRDQRAKGPIGPIIAGEEPLLETIYMARWARMAYSLRDALKLEENKMVLNDPQITADPDSLSVKTILEKCTGNGHGHSRGGTGANRRTSV